MVSSSVLLLYVVKVSAGADMLVFINQVAYFLLTTELQPGLCLFAREHDTLVIVHQTSSDVDVPGIAFYEA